MKLKIMIQVVATWIIWLVTALNGSTQVSTLDHNVRATDTLETQNVFIYQDSIIPVLDISYHEWSADGVTWRKNFVSGDSLLRISNNVKNDWVVLDYKNGVTPYWILDGLGNLYTNGELVTNNVGIDTTGNDFKLDVNGDINMWGYPFISGDSLALDNIYNGASGQDGYVLTYSGDTAIWMPLGSGYGETNIMQNVGARGVGVYDAKVDTMFNMRNIASLTNLLTVTLASDSTIDLDLVLKTITAGIGLSGGGSMEGDVTLNLYIPELIDLTTVDFLNDRVAIYDQSTATHKKVLPYYFLPSLSVGGTEFVANNDDFNFVAGDNIEISVNEANGVVISASTLLPTCTEGQVLMYLSGAWSCVDLCDYICYDPIIDTVLVVIGDSIGTILPPITDGNVTINFTRADCADSTLILASDFVTSTTNLTNVVIVTVPTVGHLSYGGITVTATDTLDVSSGSFASSLYYVSDDGTGSAYTDPFTFNVKYSSNTSYLNTFNVNVGVSACVTDAICFGYLYNWYAVDDSRELTSSADWHVPTKTDWEGMLDQIAIRSSNTWNDAGLYANKVSTLFWDNITGFTNSTGISFVGGGYRNTDGTFTDIKSRGYYQSSTSLSTNNLYSFSTYTAPNSDIEYNGGFKKYGLSTRLVSEATGIPDGTHTTYTGNDGKTYDAVAINGLYWTTENLEETQYRDGSPIPNVTDNATWAGLTTGAWCVYDNDANNACK